MELYKIKDPLVVPPHLELSLLPAEAVVSAAEIKLVV